MNKFKIFVGIFFIVVSLLIACDDFFSPTIEIFNNVETPVNIEQEQKKEQKQDTSVNQKNVSKY